MYPSRRDFFKLPASALLLNGLSKFAQANEKTRIAQVHFGPENDGAWYTQHRLAIESVRSMLGQQLEVNVVHDADSTAKGIRVFRELANAGYKLVFVTSYSLQEASLAVAPEFPHVAWEQCAGAVTLDNLGYFTAKTYEGMYLAGVASASVSKSGRLGFIGGFAEPGTISSANAFLLGARSVNPKAECQVLYLDSWFAPEREREAANTLIAQQCDVMMGMTDTPVTVQTAQEKGVHSIGYANDLREHGPNSLLASMIIDWSNVYRDAVIDVVSGQWQSKALWGGFAAETIRLLPNNATMTIELQRYLKQYIEEIAYGTAHPFRGEIMGADEKVRVAEGEVLSDDEILNMDWMVQGVSLAS